MTALFLGLGGWVGIIGAWWIALFNDWTFVATFSRYSEQWLEGILFHAIVLFLIVRLISEARLEWRERTARYPSLIIAKLVASNNTIVSLAAWRAYGQERRVVDL